MSPRIISAVIVANLTIGLSCIKADFPEYGQPEKLLEHARQLINVNPKEVRSLVERALAENTVPNSEKAFAYLVLVESYLTMGQINLGLQSAEKGLALAPQDSPIQQKLFISKADALFQKGQFAAALTLYQNVVKNGAIKNNPALQAFANQGKALCLVSMNEYEEAVKALVEASKHIQELKEPQDRASIEAAIARVYYKLGNVEKSIEYAKRSIDTISILDSPIQLNAAWYNLGEALYINEQIDEALNAFKKALFYADKVKDAVGIAYAKWGLARVSGLGSDDAEGDLKALADAKREFDKVGDLVKSINIRITIAEKLVELTRSPQALNELTEAQGLIHDERGMEAELAQIQKVSAYANLKIERYKQAFQHMEKYVELLKKHEEVKSKKQVDAFRVHLQTRLKEQENEILIKEHQLSKIEAQSQSHLIQVFKVSLFIGLAIIILILFLLIKNRRMQQRLKLISITDDLTSLNNRRYVREQLKIEFARALRHDASLCVALLDVDHFKSFNDKYGHDTGDEVLIEIAKVLSGNSRLSDICGRWGGEEFIFVMPNTVLDDAYKICERIRLKINDIIVRALEENSVSVSIGLSCCRSDDLDYKLSITRADNALYEAKRAGRGRVLWV